MPESEIHVSQIIGVVLRRWKFLVALAIVAAVVATVCVFLLPDEWTGKSVLLVRRSKAEDKSVHLDATNLEIDTFAEFTRQPQVLQDAIEKFKLHEAPFHLSREDLARLISCTPRRNTNLIDLSVRLNGTQQDGIPQLVADVCNFIADRSIQLQRELLEQEVEVSLTALRKTYQEQLDAYMQRRNAYLDWVKDARIAQAEGEVELRLHIMQEIGKDLAQDRAELHEFQANEVRMVELLEELPKAIELLDQLGNEPRFLQYLVHSNPDENFGMILSTTMTRQIINPAYETIVEDLAEVQSQIPGLIAKVAEQEQILREQQQKIQEFEQEYNLNYVRQTVEDGLLTIAQLGVEEVAMIYHAAEARIIAARQELQMLSRALPPMRPSGPKRLLIVIASIVFVVGIGLAISLAIDMVRLVERV